MNRNKIMKNIKEKKGVCKICGCTMNNPCFNPKVGFCWWADESETICSHCALPELKHDSSTVHKVNDIPGWEPPITREQQALFGNLRIAGRLDSLISIITGIIKEYGYFIRNIFKTEATVKSEPYNNDEKLFLYIISENFHNIPEFLEHLIMLQNAIYENEIEFVLKNINTFLFKQAKQTVYNLRALTLENGIKQTLHENQEIKITNRMNLWITMLSRISKLCENYLQEWKNG